MKRCASAACRARLSAIIRFVFNDPALSKRQLGSLLILLGVLTALAALGVDLFQVGRFAGIGPAQQKVLYGAFGLAALGLSLYARGDQPA